MSSLVTRPRTLVDVVLSRSRSWLFDAALLLYLAEGAVGLPVFAGGASSVAYMLGPTGGYLIGFVVAAGVVGWLAERGWDRRPAWTVLAMVAGNVAIYVFG